jgi:hypothetical protein
VALYVVLLFGLVWFGTWRHHWQHWQIASVIWRCMSSYYSAYSGLVWFILVYFGLGLFSLVLCFSAFSLLLPFT